MKHNLRAAGISGLQGIPKPLDTDADLKTTNKFWCTPSFNFDQVFIKAPAF